MTDRTIEEQWLQQLVDEITIDALNMLENNVKEESLKEAIIGTVTVFIEEIFPTIKKAYEERKIANTQTKEMKDMVTVIVKDELLKKTVTSAINLMDQETLDTLKNDVLLKVKETVFPK